MNGVLMDGYYHFHLSGSLQIKENPSNKQKYTFLKYFIFLFLLLQLLKIEKILCLRKSEVSLYLLFFSH